MYIQCDKLETLQGYFKFVHGERYFTFVTFLFRSQLQESNTSIKKIYTNWNKKLNYKTFCRNKIRLLLSQVMPD